MVKIGVFDYGIGNLRSVANALSELGIPAVVSADPDVLASCQRYVLPGVGAFPFGMDALKDRGLDRLVLRCADERRPMLGICLGMQMLGEYSDEFCRTAGLGLVEGGAAHLRPSADAAESVRLPHVGWVGVKPTGRAQGLAQRILARTDPAARFYFVHSYALPPDVSTTVSTACYGAVEFAAIVARGNIIGTQFHPEKSGPSGLKFLGDFCQLELD